MGEFMAMNWQAVAVCLTLFTFVMTIYASVNDRARKAEFEILRLSISSLEKSVEKHEASIGKKVDLHSSELAALRNTISDHAMRLVRVESTKIA